ncbi:MAG: hypothetical protein H7835_10525 [Magnetococcus sp. XQGC-1]
MLSAGAGRRGEAGVGLVELLMGILVGAVVLGGLVSVHVATSKANAENLKLARLNQEVRAIMGIMTREIRRAGYWGIVPGSPGTASHPAYAANLYGGGTVNLSLNPFWAVNVAGSCITFSYDLNDNGLLDSGEWFGFQLMNVGGAGVVEMRTSGADGSCSWPAGSYQPLNNGQLTTVTDLSFTLASNPVNATTEGGACATNQGCQEIRLVNIVLTARLQSDSTVTQTVREQVRLRNDRYYVLP